MIRSRFVKTIFVLFILLSANTIAFSQVGGSEPFVNRNGSTDIQSIKILIAYQSKYGSTKQYAEWIRESTAGDLVNIDNEDKTDLAGYNIIIIGGSVRVGSIVIAPFIRDHWRFLKGKNIILFTTSGTPPRHPKIQGIYEKSLPDEIRSEIRYFPLHGRISGENLTLWDRFLMVIGKIMERDETLKKDMGKDFDGVQRENLLPLLEYLKEIKTTLRDKEMR